MVMMVVMVLKSVKKDIVLKVHTGMALVAMTVTIV